MYGHINHKDRCLSVTARLATKPLDITTTIVDEAVLFITDATKHVHVKAQQVSTNPIITIKQVGKPIISCGLVCTVNEVKKILEVQPEIVFLTMDNNWTADVEIISNVEWLIN